MAKLFIAVCAVAIVFYGCPVFSGHHFEGKWQCGNARIVIYEDGIASYFGGKATWKKIDRRSIRIEFTENDRTMIGELAETEDSAGEGKANLLSIGRADLKCSRVQ